MTEASVTLREYADARVADLRLLGGVVVISILAAVFIMNAGNEKAIALALEGQKEATKVALDASNDKGKTHNGLIERMREMSATFITRGNVFSFITALGICTGIYLAFVKGT